MMTYHSDMTNDEKIDWQHKRLADNLQLRRHYRDVIPDSRRAALRGELEKDYDRACQHCVIELLVLRYMRSCRNIGREVNVHLEYMHALDRARSIGFKPHRVYE